MKKIILCVLAVGAVSIQAFASMHLHNALNIKMSKPVSNSVVNGSTVARNLDRLNMKSVQLDSMKAQFTKSNSPMNAQAANPDSVGLTWWDEQACNAMPNMCINLSSGIGSMIALGSLQKTLTTLGSYFATNVDGTSGFKGTLSGGAKGWKAIQTDSRMFTAMSSIDDGSELVVAGGAAFPPTSTLTLNVHSTSQTGTWTSRVITGSAGAICPSISVSDSNFIHVLYAQYMSTPNGNDRGIFRHPCWLVYQVSKDTGKTWSPLDTVAANVVPGAYVMTASGRNVAMVYNFLGNMETIVSTDNGSDSSWSTHGFQSSAHTRGTDSVGLQHGDTTHYLSDSALVYGNQFDALIDPTGKIHFAVHYATAYIDSVATSKAFLGYYWVYAGVYYPNDTVGGIIYFNNDTTGGTYKIRMCAPAEGDPNGSITISQSSLFYADGDDEGGFTAQPQLGFRSTGGGSVYLLYQSYNQNDVFPILESDGNTYLFMYAHLYSVTSTNADYSGWTAPVPITPDGMDARFPSLADNVDDHAVMTYIADYSPYQRVQDLYYGSITGWPSDLQSGVVGRSVPVSVLQTAGVDEKNEIVPGTISIAQNYPNPFNPQTWIQYSLANSTTVKLEVTDVLGRHVATLANYRQDAGLHTATFDASQVPPGVYVYTLTAGQHRMSKNMILTK